MDPVTMYTMKYEAMERAETEQARRLAHDAGNCAMMIILSEYGAVKMLGRFKASVN